jgi:UDP-2,3-diacylglucosamine hydrolase
MAGKLGILAGGGELPKLLIRKCREAGRPVHVIALSGHAEPAVVGMSSHDWVRLGAAAEAFSKLREAGAEEVVFAGKIRRPGLSELVPDWRTARFLAHIGGRLLSDNRLIDAIIKEFEAEGFRVVGPADVAPELLARSGPYGKLLPTAAETRAIGAGFAAAREGGRRDLGQAAVVRGEAVIGLEGPDGTDALIDRVASRPDGGAGAILVKARKPQQEMRADPPVVGPATVGHAAAANFRGIAIEAGGVLVLDPERLAAEADEAGMFLLGVDPPP